MIKRLQDLNLSLGPAAGIVAEIRASLVTSNSAHVQFSRSSANNLVHLLAKDIELDSGGTFSFHLLLLM